MFAFCEFTYIIAIVETGGFSSAARKLHISQPSLSQYVKKLEEDIGFPIFDRTKKPLSLTHSGKRYLAFAQEVLERRDGFLQSIDRNAGVQQGHLTVGVSFARSLYFIPRLLPPLHKRYPGLSIELLEQSAPNLENAILKGSIDIAITTLPIPAKGIAYKLLLNELLLIAIPSQNKLCDELVSMPDRKYPVIDLRKAANEPFVMLPAIYKLRALTDQICIDAGFTPSAIITTANFSTAHRLAGVGLGLHMGPETLFHAEIVHPTPVYATFSIKDYIWPIVIAYRADKFFTPAMKVFVEIAREQLADEKHK